MGAEIEEAETNMGDEDILAKTIITEEATVRKAGGKFKMNPLFPSTTTKIKAVRLANPPTILHVMEWNINTNLQPDVGTRQASTRRYLDFRGN